MFPQRLIINMDYTKKQNKKKKALVVFPCFCCCRILRKNPSNVLSSRLLQPQLVPPSDTPTLSTPHMGTSVEKKTGEELRSSEASLDRLYRQKLVTVFLLFFLLERHSWKKKSVKGVKNMSRLWHWWWVLLFLHEKQQLVVKKRKGCCGYMAFSNATYTILVLNSINSPAD